MRQAVIAIAFLGLFSGAGAQVILQAPRPRQMGDAIGSGDYARYKVLDVQAVEGKRQQTAYTGTIAIGPVTGWSLSSRDTNAGMYSLTGADAVPKWGLIGAWGNNVGCVLGNAAPLGRVVWPVAHTSLEKLTNDPLIREWDKLIGKETVTVPAGTWETKRIVQCLEGIQAANGANALYIERWKYGLTDIRYVITWAVNNGETVTPLAYQVWELEECVFKQRK